MSKRNDIDPSDRLQEGDWVLDMLNEPNRELHRTDESEWDVQLPEPGFNGSITHEDCPVDGDGEVDTTSVPETAVCTDCGGYIGVGPRS